MNVRTDTEAAIGPPERFYVPALDGLRFFAFFSVLVHHLPESGFAPWLARAQAFGWVGVDLFFVISSYLFFRLLSIERERRDRVDVVRFYVRRALRIWPTYYLFATAMFVATLAADGEWAAPRATARFIGLALFSDNLLMWLDGFNPIRSAAHLWTLSFEEQVYLVIPPVFAGLYALGPKRGAQIALVAIAIGTLLRVAVMVLRDDSHVVIWSCPVLRPESIILGALLGLGVAKEQLARVPTFAKVGAGLTLLAIGVLLPPLDEPGWQQLYLYPMTAVGSTLLVAAALDRSHSVDVVLSNRAIVFFGKISYGLYLFHLVAISIARRALGISASSDPFIDATQWLSLAIAAFVLVTIVATVSYYVIERPALRLKERFAVVHSRPA